MSWFLNMASVPRGAERRKSWNGSLSLPLSVTLVLLLSGAEGGVAGGAGGCGGTEYVEVCDGGPEEPTEPTNPVNPDEDPIGGLPDDVEEKPHSCPAPPAVVECEACKTCPPPYTGPEECPPPARPAIDAPDCEKGWSCKLVQTPGVTLLQCFCGKPGR